MQNHMRIKFVLIIAGWLATSLSGAAGSPARIEIKDHWYYLDGKKFFIKGIGYEIGARPGQNPYDGVRADDLDLMRFDLKVIKEGGYNAIRTWSQFSEPQLKLVQSSGLKLIMGIEINPGADYSDPVFVRTCEESLGKVLSYAKKYDCIITYLILNEPQTDHLHRVSGKAFVDLMQRLMGMIHQQHPGIPVTISANAMISDFLDENLFDVYAYNCYDHSEAQTATMGMRDYIRGLVDLNGRKKPLITTEFGYSVSRHGEHGYGGNTLNRQRDGLLANYRDLLDAGAVGMCPFYYADGWWKGGNPKEHSVEQPEEWFGFWGYSDANDRFGSPRPVWFAMQEYMKALILSPRNGSIHASSTVPLELYVDKDVRQVVVKLRDRAIYAQRLSSEGYFAGQLPLSPNGLEDMELSFEFYDRSNALLKTESIMILASSKPIEWPTLSIEVAPVADLGTATQATIKTTIRNREPFKIVGDLNVSFNTHLGWKVGPQETVSLANQLNQSTITSECAFPIPADCWVVNASAGVAVQYGKFNSRIHDQKIIFRGDWAKEIGHR